MISFSFDLMFLSQVMLDALPQFSSCYFVNKLGTVTGLGYAFAFTLFISFVRGNHCEHCVDHKSTYFPFALPLKSSNQVSDLHS